MIFTQAKGAAPRPPAQDDFEVAAPGQSIPVLSSYTLEVQLDRSDYRLGHLLLYIPNAAVTSYKRQTAAIVFGTALDDAQSMACGKTTYSVYGYYFTDRWIKGYRYDDDTQLSEYYYQGAGGGQILIKSCLIDGDKLKITFYNPHGYHAATLRVKGRYHVWR